MDQWQLVPGSHPWTGAFMVPGSNQDLHASAEPFESRSRRCDVSGRWPQRRRWKRPSGPQPTFSEMLPWSRIPWKRLTIELAFGRKLKEERRRRSSVFVWVTNGSQQARTNPERTLLICVNRHLFTWSRVGNDSSCSTVSGGAFLGENISGCLFLPPDAGKLQAE